MIVLAWKLRLTATFALAAFAITYFLFISTFRICNDRTLLPVIPCILLMAAMFMEYVFGSEAPFRRIGQSLRYALPLSCLMVLIAFPLLTTAIETEQLTKIDSRTTAREWINTSLRSQSVVAVESYSPYVDPDRFKVIRSERASEHSPDWYVSQGIDYLVLSEGMFGRYLSPPYEHITETAQYLKLMERFELIKKFTDGGYTVLVYKVR
jgi:hypothetical protein